MNRFPAKEDIKMKSWLKKASFFDVIFCSYKFNKRTFRNQIEIWNNL